MSQLVDLDDLVDIATIAKRFYTGKTTVDNWSKRHDDYPQPLKTFGRSPVYSWEAITEWYIRQYGRKKFDRETSV